MAEGRSPDETSRLLPTGQDDVEGPKRRVLCLELSEDQVSAARSACGYLFIVSAGLLFTAGNVLWKAAAPELNFWHMLVYRAAMQVAVMLADLALRRLDPRGPAEHRRRVLLQGGMGGFMLLCIFVAVRHVPLGNCSAIFFCNPVFTFLFAVPMLGERLGGYRAAISALMLGGVVLITRPPFIFHDDDGSTSPDIHNATHFNLPRLGDVGSDPYTSDHLLAVAYACAFLVPLMSSVVSILFRQLRSIRASIVILWFGVSSFLVGVGGRATKTPTYVVHHQFDSALKRDAHLRGHRSLRLLPPAVLLHLRHQRAGPHRHALLQLRRQVQQPNGRARIRESAAKIFFAPADG